MKKKLKIVMMVLVATLCITSIFANRGKKQEKVETELQDPGTEAEVESEAKTGESVDTVDASDNTGENADASDASAGKTGNGTHAAGNSSYSVEDYYNDNPDAMKVEIDEATTEFCTVSAMVQKNTINITYSLTSEYSEDELKAYSEQLKQYYASDEAKSLIGNDKKALSDESGVSVDKIVFDIKCVDMAGNALANATF